MFWRRLDPVWQLCPVTVRIPSHQLHWLLPSVCRLSPAAGPLLLQTHLLARHTPLTRTAPITCRVCPSSPRKEGPIKSLRTDTQGERARASGPLRASRLDASPTRTGHPIVDLPDPLSKTSDPTPLLSRNIASKAPGARVPTVQGPPVLRSVVPQGRLLTHRRVPDCLHFAACSKGQGSTGKESKLPLCDQQPWIRSP